MREQHNQRQDENPTEAAPPEVVPQLYVASLTDYNNGILHGRWLDAAVEPEELSAGIQAMLEESPAHVDTAIRLRSGPSTTTKASAPTASVSSPQLRR